MEIKILDGAIKTSQEQHDYIMNKVGSAASRLNDTSSEVVVRLSDTNGHRGGVDKLCTIHVTTPGMQSVRVEEHALEYYGAIDAASAALKRSLAKTLERQKTNGPR